MLLRFDHFILLHFFYRMDVRAFWFHFIIVFMFCFIFFLLFFLVFPGIPAAPGMPCPGEDREYYSHLKNYYNLSSLCNP